MIIKRKLFGIFPVRFALTDAELMEAHHEYWRGCLAEDIKARIHEHTDDLPDDWEVWLPGFGDVKASALRALLKNDDEIAQMAAEMENALDENGCISDCFWDTADNVLAEHI